MSIGPLIQIEPGRFIDGRCVTQVMYVLHYGIHNIRVVDDFGNTFSVICETKEEAVEKATKLAGMVNDTKIAGSLVEQGNQELVSILRRALLNITGDNWRDDAARLV